MHGTSMTPLLVIVLGPPASGKTTLARRLAAGLSWPLMTKDMIKEELYEVLGGEDIEQSRRLGHASIMLLLQFAEVQVAAQRSCLVECNFRRRWHNVHFRALQERYPYEPLQVLCRASHSVLAERYRRRAESGERHPVHMDAGRLGEYDEALVREQSVPLEIGGRVIEVDTTDFAAIDYAALVEQIRAMGDCS